jgi:putative transposase
MARSRYQIYDKQAPHFLTCTVVDWLPIFTNPSIVDILYASWRFLQAHERLIIFAYVIMENHLHLVAASPDLAKEIGDFKSFTARQIIDNLKDKNAQGLLQQLVQSKLAHKQDRDYQVWQEGSHPQIIKDDEMMWQTIGYIHNNPVKRGYVDDPIHWRYSSARNYAGLPNLLEVVQAW